MKRTIYLSNIRTYSSNNELVKLKEEAYVVLQECKKYWSILLNKNCSKEELNFLHQFNSLIIEISLLHKNISVFANGFNEDYNVAFSPEGVRLIINHCKLNLLNLSHRYLAYGKN